MAIRQYIGARYVPRFIGTYDPTQIYDALDVVDNGSGTSYIARKTVPAGTPLTDTDHWFVYGASSGAIIALQNDMIQAQNDILTLQGDVAADQGDIARLKEPKVIIITDSYGSRVNSASKNVTDLLNDFGRDLADIQIVSGGSFAATDPAKKWYNYVNLYSGDKTKITDVIFCGSINDGSYSENDVYNAAVTTLNYAKSEYPNAKIHIISWGVCFANSALGDAYDDGVHNAYVKACNETGCIYAENAIYMLRNSDLLESDLIHPNGDGVDYLAGQINQYLLGRSIDVRHQITVTLTPHSGGATIAGFTAQPFIMTRHNGEVTFEATWSVLSALEFDIATPASGIINLGYAIDMDKTLASHSSITNRHKYAMNGYGRTTDPIINDAQLNVLFCAKMLNIAFAGSVYGSTYNHFFLKQYMLVMND